MIEVPIELKEKFNLYHQNRETESSLVVNGLHWLRKYLNFCADSKLAYQKETSLKSFLETLALTQETDEDRKQAREAVEIYFFLYRQKHGFHRNPAPKEEYLKPSTKISGQLTKSPWQEAIEKLTKEIETRHYSPKTLKTYKHWIQKFQGFTEQKPIEKLASEDIKSFLTYLAVREKVAAATQNQAFNALLFFFRHILKREFEKLEGVTRAKRRPYIPVVLSRKEIDKILSCLKNPYSLLVKLLYGCGLRLSEGLNLRVNSFNLDAGILTVHDGKGKKDRTVPLPKAIFEDIENQIEIVRKIHKAGWIFRAILYVVE
jgi:hypothetical protein